MVESENSKVKGMKFDTGKPMWGLLPFQQIAQIVQVLNFGAKKYTRDNWKHLEDGRNRYFDALLRHLTAWWEGERVDPETGLSHLAHAGCNLFFLMFFDDRDNGYVAGHAHLYEKPSQTGIFGNVAMREGASEELPAKKSRLV